MANVARFLVLGFLDFLRRRNLETGIFLPFLVFVDFRNFPRFEGLILIPERLRRLAIEEILQVTTAKRAIFFVVALFEMLAAI